MEIKSIKLLSGMGFTCVGNALMNVLPENFNWLGWPILGVGILMLMAAGQDYLFHHLSWKIYWKSPQFKILMSLKEASEKALEQLDGSQWQKANLRNDIVRGKIFHQYARHIGNEYTLYGQKYPATRLEPIDKRDDPDIAVRITPDLTQTLLGSGAPEFENLMITKKDLKKFIKDRKDK